MSPSSSPNIEHKRVVKHVVRHQVRWDYLVIGLVVGYVAYQILGGIGSSSNDDQVAVEFEPTRGDTTKAFTGAFGGN